jgi:formylglycine-generating enzyme required for sulfatase activity
MNLSKVSWLALVSLLACSSTWAADSQNAAAPVAAFRDCPECPEMVVIPAGSFDMGSPAGESGRRDIEGPVHRVTIATFALGRAKITRAQFAAYAAETGHDGGKDCVTFEAGSWDSRVGRDWLSPGFPQEDSHPVVCINWQDAKAYAAWLSKKTGKTYRLPSEAEWEYAARAGTTTARYWGDNADQACGYANVLDRTAKARLAGVNAEGHACTDAYAYTAPVMSFKPNGFGLYDMIGNAWEWLEDCGSGSDYRGVPQDGRPSFLGDCNYRGLRGGSWSSPPQDARSASRSRGVAMLRGNGDGFRLVRVLP